MPDNTSFPIRFLDWQIEQSQQGVDAIIEALESAQSACVSVLKIGLLTWIGWQEDAHMDTRVLEETYDYVKTSAPFYTALQSDSTRAVLESGIRAAQQLRDQLAGTPESEPTP
jgi:hypothetical protein